MGEGQGSEGWRVSKFRLQGVGLSDEWYTPPAVFQVLQCEFDMDVASPGAEIVWWIPAREHITAGSLQREWSGFVWMNPPFGGRGSLVPWLQKFVRHGNGICLVPDRTSAPWWQECAPRMGQILFVSPKLRFIRGDGKKADCPAQGTCLMSVGERGYEALQRATALGVTFVPQNVVRFDADQFIYPVLQC